MAVTFNGEMIFGTGPQRLSVRPVGLELLQRFRVIPNAPGLQPNGFLDFAVVVRGRLVSGEESGLWELRDAIAQALTDPPQAATLIDGHGREFENMRFVSFAAGDRTDRGRVASLAFEALFVQFNHWP